MTVRNLDKLLSPNAVALIGATDRPGALGDVLRQRLLSSGFNGQIGLVNPKRAEIDGRACAPSVEALGFAPDLGVVVTPAPTIPGVIAELGAAGARAAVVITAGVDKKSGLRQAMLDAARPYGLRILGPNCLGMMVPKIGLDASFAQLSARPGSLALLSQSGAIVTAMLDWAEARGIGFSAVASLGDMADVDAADLLDWLAADPGTSAILMYLEHVTNARKFMSAARAAARAKPVIVVKSGRTAAASAAAASHTGALAGSDAVYDAAFRRAGVLRVNELEDLFDAAEALARHRPLNSDRLAILTNGGGAGVLAADQIDAASVRLADLSLETLTALDDHLPATWSKRNPVDIIGDADGARYKAAMTALLHDPTADAILVMNCPTGLASSLDAANAVIEAIDEAKAAGIRAKPVLSCWLGDATARRGAEALETAGVPVFRTPAQAIRGFGLMVDHRKAQKALMRVPPSLPEDFRPDDAAVSAVLAAAQADGRRVLNEVEAKAVLRAYGIATVPTEVAQTPTQAAQIAATMLDDPTVHAVVVKILSPDITHKSDVGGVRLNIASPGEAKDAATAMIDQARYRRPEARIDGVVVQPMIRKPNAHELIIGLSLDPTFGPVVMFGAGGTSVEVVADRALALPPLDMMLARDLIGETRVSKLLAGYRNRLAADIDGVALSLVRLAQLAVDHPMIAELDVNPLLANENGVVALDARVAIDFAADAGRKNDRLALRPYPSEWDRPAETLSAAIQVRPIRPDDARKYAEFFRHLTPEDIHFRFFGMLQALSEEQLARFTQLDYARSMAFVAVDPKTGALLGVSRLMADPDLVEAEYAVIVRSDRKGEGIGWALMVRLIAFARAEGIGAIVGDVLDGNERMLEMCRDLGFVEGANPSDRSLRRVRLDLATAATITVDPRGSAAEARRMSERRDAS